MTTDTKRDYFDVLGLSRKASEAEVKKAFRKLGRKYHPDVKSGDKTAEQKFKELNEAYEVLSDTKKRKQYDQFGHAAFDGAAGAGAGLSSTSWIWSSWLRTTARQVRRQPVPLFWIFYKR